MKCGCMSRRGFIGTTLGGALGWAFMPGLRALMQDSDVKAKSCILVFLSGGPSHLDTFDPKPGTPTGGPVKAIESAVSGIRLSEYLPQIGREMKDIAVVRSLTHGEADHGRAQHLLHTGYPQEESVTYPGIGSQFARQFTVEDAAMPSYVTLGVNPYDPIGAGPGFHGEPYAAFAVDAPGETPTILRRGDDVSPERYRRVLRLLTEFDKGAGKHVGESVEQTQLLRARAARYMDGKLPEALDLGREKDPLRQRYGMARDEADNLYHEPFGQACLQAVRLVEAGVKFVEVLHSGWDTHADNFKQTAAMCGQLDPGVASMMQDLRSRGLLAATLVVVMGEFGRTPEINAQDGRDHHAAAFSAMLAGGGIKGGQVVGATNASGHEVAERPVSAQDLLRTIYRQAGVDPTKRFTTPEGRPIRILDGGKVVEELT